VLTKKTQKKIFSVGISGVSTLSPPSLRPCRLQTCGYCIRRKVIRSHSNEMSSEALIVSWRHQWLVFISAEVEWSNPLCIHHCQSSRGRKTSPKSSLYFTVYLTLLSLISGVDGRPQRGMELGREVTTAPGIRHADSHEYREKHTHAAGMRRRRRHS